MPCDIQLGIIGLQCDSNMKEKLTSVGLKVCMYLFPDYPKLRDMAAKILCKFGTTFAVMSINKNRLRSRLANKNLNNILKPAASHKISLNVDALVKAKRCQVSGS